MEKLTPENCPVPFNGHSIGPLTAVQDHTGRVIGQTVAVQRKGEGAPTVWFRLHCAGVTGAWRVIEPTPASAPVADERADFNAWLKTQRNPDDMNKAELVAAWEAWQERGRRAALASAPVAGEAIAGYMVGTDYFRPDVLAAARIYAENRNLPVRTLRYADAAPQASEAVPVCARCGGTGEADSGGTHPWGATIYIPCECSTVTGASQLSDDEVTGLMDDGSAMAALADNLEIIKGNENAALAAVIVRRVTRDRATAGSVKFAFDEFIQKTEFVQQWLQAGKLPAKYLGWHRADVLRDALEAMQAGKTVVTADMIRVARDAYDKAEFPELNKWKQALYAALEQTK